jgi:hypothetical protein
MAVDFGLLNTQLPEQIATSFSRGYEGAQQNQLARQKMAQEQETNALRRQEAELGLQRTRGLMQQEEEAQKNARLNQKISGFRERILRARTPDDARKIVQMQYSDADISPVVSQYATLEQALAEVPDDPNEFRTYLNQEAMGIDEWIKSQAQAQQKELIDRNKLSERRFINVGGGLVFDTLNEQYVQPPSMSIGRAPRAAALSSRAASGAAKEAAAPQAKPMTELQQQKVNKERVDDLQGVKAAKSTADELEKLTDELVGNPAKKIPQHPGYQRIIGFESKIPFTLPGGDAAKAEQKLETFKGKISTFGRQLASQYGKLGNMAVQEWKIVSDSVQNINPAAGNLDEQMRDVVRQARDFEKSMQEKYNALYGNEGQQPATPAQPATKGSRTVTRTGKIDGRRVVQYSDGSVEYAD